MRELERRKVWRRESRRMPVPQETEASATATSTTTSRAVPDVSQALLGETKGARLHSGSNSGAAQPSATTTTTTAAVVTAAAAAAAETRLRRWLVHKGRRQHVNLPLELGDPAVRLLLALPGRLGDDTEPLGLPAPHAPRAARAVRVRIRIAADLEAATPLTGAGLLRGGIDGIDGIGGGGGGGGGFGCGRGWVGVAGAGGGRGGGT